MFLGSRIRSATAFALRQGGGLLAVTALAFVTISLQAQQPAAPAKAPSPVPAAAAPAPYRFAPGDTMDVKFDYVRDLNDTVRVRPDGFISLQRVGEVRVVGMTPGSLPARSRKSTPR